MKDYQKYAKKNLIFIFLVLNVWEFAISRVIFNAMFIGLVLFGPVTFLWYLNRFRAVVLLTVISILEFMMMLVFLWEGFELNGLSLSLKSIFWVPFLGIAGVNATWGLNIYSKKTQKEGR